MGVGWCWAVISFFKLMLEFLGGEEGIKEHLAKKVVEGRSRGKEGRRTAYLAVVQVGVVVELVVLGLVVCQDRTHPHMLFPLCRVKSWTYANGK